jgi:hypothetical protein
MFIEENVGPGCMVLPFHLAIFFLFRQKLLLLISVISYSHHLLSKAMSWLIWAIVSLSIVNIFAPVLGCWWTDILISTSQILYVLFLNGTLNMTVIRFPVYVYLVILVQARVLREFSPEEVTANIYTMVDVLLHHIQLDLQRGHLVQVY